MSWKYLEYSDELLNIILECPRGFYDDCSKKCTPPHYGEGCQSECNCAAGYYCHFADGCSKSIKGDDAANKKSSMI